MIQVPEEYEIEGGAAPERTGAISMTEEREALERVLRHPEIRRSTSLVRFLSFICEMYFQQRTAEIREHAIAVRALGRKESTFDSQADPIVRVNARALRKRLREFYDNEGRNEPVEIVIPVGHYVPQFVRRVTAAETQRALEALEAVSAEASATHAEREPLVATTVAVKVDGAQPAMTALRHEDTQPAMVPEAGFWRRHWWLVAMVLLGFPAVFVAGMVLGRHPAPQTESSADTLRWGAPVWSDEFSGAAMQLPDPARWTYDVGDQNRWGNHELESYCSPLPGSASGCDPHRPNAFLDGAGHLVLRAQRNADGNWTSARLTTRGLKNFQYGRIEARMKLPVGTGLWPAFWLLGADFPKVGWPQAGSVDIVENVSTSARANSLGASRIRASLHTPGFAGGNSLRRDYQLPNGGRIDDGGFHTYGVIWSPGMMQFYVDDPSNIYFVQTVSDLPQGGSWVFDRPFYLVMDLAVGGDWAGDPDNTTPSPADVVVDYVRVYRIPTAVPSLELAPVQVSAGAMATAEMSLQGQRNMGRVYVACRAEPATALCSLESSTVDLSATPQAREMVTVSTVTEQDGQRRVAKPGTYRLTVTATNMSGDQTSISEPFEVSEPRRSPL
jgi:beta-glucanase (GH16 family)